MAENIPKTNWFIWPIFFQAIAYDLPELLTSYKKKISQPPSATKAAPKK